MRGRNTRMAEPIENDQERDEERRRKGLLPFFILIAVIIVLILLLMNFLKGGTSQQTSTSKRSTTVVPNVIGLAEKAAIDRLESAGFKVDKVVKAATGGEKVGIVVSQVPAGGDSLVKGSTVSITLTGPEVTGASIQFPAHASPPTVPNVVGKPKDTAIGMIEAAGYTVSVSELFSDVVPAGQVITQNPSGGTNLDPGSKVEIVVSAGKQPIKNVVVPDLSGMTRQQATDAVTARGLTPYAVYGPQKKGIGGLVISQWPAAGTVVAEGTQVTFQTGY